jgi:predicted trehalose synthase
LKQSALKDVAGMLRSLDYAVATVTGQLPERREVLEAWLADAERAFLDAYRMAVAAAGVPLVPQDDSLFWQGLDLLIAEKALYEARYELNNRPDWIGIPLNALLRLSAQERA